MKTNTKATVEKKYTHGGAVASSHVNGEEQLRRSVMACMLWEDTFYESGVNIVERIKDGVVKVTPEVARNIAIEARNKMKLRHVPLLIVREMARIDSHKKYVADTLAEVIQRPDELSEFVALYWKDGKQPLSAQVKKGLARAFNKFNEYSLAKYNRDETIKLRDVLFLCHAKPKDEDLFKRLIDDKLTTPDTWEVNLSGGADKKTTFERMIDEKKLGALAMLRNLRNMIEAKVSESKIREGLKNMKIDRVLPFRFISAAKYAPKFEPEIESAMFKCLNGMEKLKGKTVLIIDTSGSMNGRLSTKSELSRLEAAAALTILTRELCEEVAVYATAGSDMTRIHQTMLVPSRRGFALRDLFVGHELTNKIGGGGIFLKQCMDYVFEKEQTADRVIVFTDEQDCDIKANPDTANAFGQRNYIINIASNQNGIAYNKNWHHINGFSEAVIQYIQQFEEAENNSNQN